MSEIYLKATRGLSYTTLLEGYGNASFSDTRPKHWKNQVFGSPSRLTDPQVPSLPRYPVATKQTSL